MRLLFEMDKKDYGGCAHSFTRDSARSIIIRNGKIAMIHSLKYDYYKFPGGGIEPGECAVDALIRETAEEAGLIVIPDSIREYGHVHRIQKSTVKEDEHFIGKFCQIAAGVEFMMNDANHQMNAVSTFPFYTLGGWDMDAPATSEMPFKGVESRKGCSVLSRDW